MTLDRVIGVTVAIGIAFVLLGTVIVGFVDDSAEFNSCSTRGSIISCASCNDTTEDSTGYELFKENCHSLVGSQNNTHCYGCNQWGFRTTQRGLAVLVLTMGVIGIGLTVFRYA